MTPRKPPLPPSDKPRRGRPRGSADLTKISGVHAEQTRLYREWLNGKAPQAFTGIRMLAHILDTLTVAMLEKRLAQLENETYGGSDVLQSEAVSVRHLNS